MSEEELVTLQELQYAIKNIGSFDFGDFNHETIISVLNLIEKQQKEIENSVSKDKIRETIKIIDGYYRMAKEGEEESKAQGYFDGTNIGRRQAHNTDIYQLKKLLEE